MATKAQVKKCIETIAPLAMAEYKKGKKILPSVCIAQACCESSYLTSQKMINANAVFGIKVGKSKYHFGKAWKDKAYSTKTKECYDGRTYTDITDMFRAYDTIQESVEDYYDLLCNASRYKKAVGETNPKKAITSIKDGGYATDPKYVSTIMSIINNNNLTQYDTVGNTEKEKPVVSTAVIVGSARIDENGKITGGVAGDQIGKEVSTQPYYMHSKGWYLLRPKDVSDANKIARAMQNACDNNNIGYCQGHRTTVITMLQKYGSMAVIKEKTEADCSSLVRACCIEAGFDPGNFNTASEGAALDRTGRFEPRKAVTASTILYNGDILVTKTKGHTVIVVSGNPRKSNENEHVSDSISKAPRRRSTVKYGSRGEDVVYLQQRLTTNGYGVGAIDGIFGVKTLEAVKAFQEKSKLSVDGIVGVKTWVALG